MQTGEPRNGKPTVGADQIDPLLPGATGTGLPEGLEASRSSQAGVAWTGPAGMIYVVTMGSSSCPVIAEVTGEMVGEELVVGLLPPANEICTKDFVPTTSVVGVPDDVADGASVTVRLGEIGSVELPAREVEGETGDIAWVEQ